MKPVLWVLLDFDGTISPIVRDPGRARLDPAAAGAIRRLARRGDVRVAVVSGRGLDDLRRRVRVPGVLLVGNHGAEMEAPGRAPRRAYAARDATRIRGIEGQLRRALRGIRGVRFENKGPILAVHERGVAAGNRRHVARAVRAAARGRGLAVAAGKRVWEVRVAGLPDKGWVVRRLLARAPGPAIYFGDDVTDRDAFRALRGRGLRIQVGPGDGEADLRLPGVRDVARALRSLVDHLEAR